MITLQDITCLHPTAEDLCEKLRRFGVARVPQFLTDIETSVILSETKHAVSRPNYQNPYGPCSRFSLRPLPPHLARSRDLMRGDSLEPLPSEFAQSERTLASIFLRDVIKSYLGSMSGYMEVVVFTRDHIPDPGAMYGRLHFDRRHQLKFIFYLNDVDDSNGAFGCIPGTHTFGRKLFMRRWREALDLQTDNDLMIADAAARMPEDRLEYSRVRCIMENSGARTLAAGRRRVSISGSAGTLVAFDTNLLHYGGFVTCRDRERWTLKGHTFARLPSEAMAE